jgi:hypothetical protein
MVNAALALLRIETASAGFYQDANARKARNHRGRLE